MHIVMGSCHENPALDATVQPRELCPGGTSTELKLHVVTEDSIFFGQTVGNTLIRDTLRLRNISWWQCVDRV
jgi:hypothetical protein